MGRTHRRRLETRRKTPRNTRPSSKAIKFFFAAAVISLCFLYQNFGFIQPFDEGITLAVSITEFPTRLQPEKIAYGKTYNNTSLETLVNGQSESSGRQQKAKTKRPPFSKLIRGNETHLYLLQKDLSVLVDIAYIGHSNCGSSIHEWFLDHPQICIEDIERNGMGKGLVNTINIAYQYPIDCPYVAYKRSDDIIDEASILTIRDHFPKTKLIIGILHPVLWFQSLCNNFTEAASLISHCNANHHTCTANAKFHLQIAKALRRTPMTSEREVELLGEIVDSSTTKLSNSVFFFEFSQLFDPNEIRNVQFRQDFSDFLGLNQSFPAASNISRENKTSRMGEQHRINICNDEFANIRELLMRHAKNIAAWIREFFLDCEDVVVSSREYLNELLETYIYDPCEKKDEPLMKHFF